MVPAPLTTTQPRSMTDPLPRLTDSKVFFPPNTLGDISGFQRAPVSLHQTVAFFQNATGLFIHNLIFHRLLHL